MQFSMTILSPELETLCAGSRVNQALRRENSRSDVARKLDPIQDCVLRAVVSRFLLTEVNLPAGLRRDHAWALASLSDYVQ